MVKITEKQHEIFMSIGNRLGKMNIPISYNLLRGTIFIENVTLSNEDTNELLVLLNGLYGPNIDGDVVYLDLYMNNTSTLSCAGVIVANFRHDENKGLVYLYYVHGGNLCCDEVEIFKEQHSSATCYTTNGIFSCADKPLTVEHNTVWMRERNDTMAIGLLLHDTLEKWMVIKKEFEMKKQQHKAYLNILIKGVKGE